MKEPHLGKNRVSSMLCAVGLGGFVTLYVVRVSKQPLAELSGGIRRMSVETQMEQIQAYLPELVILFISSLALLFALLFLEGKAGWIKRLLWMGALLIHLASITITIVQGRIPTIYLVILWISMAWLIWMLLHIGKGLYRRIRSRRTGIENPKDAV